MRRETCFEPSRSETVTGRYLHNVHTPPVEKQCNESYSGEDDAGNVCCMHVDEVLVNNYTMAKYMKAQKGYTSGMFGKYLNNCPDTAQPGWDAWFANGGGNCKCSSSLCVFFQKTSKEAAAQLMTASAAARWSPATCCSISAARAAT